VQERSGQLLHLDHRQSPYSSIKISIEEAQFWTSFVQELQGALMRQAKRQNCSLCLKTNMVSVLYVLLGLVAGFSNAWATAQQQQQHCCKQGPV
jgi:hypothetical protein